MIIDDIDGSQPTENGSRTAVW